MMKKFKALVYLGFVFTLGLAGIHKTLGDFPPAWFMAKFEGSIIDLFPGSISLSFGIITALELFTGVLFLINVLNILRNRVSEKLVSWSYFSAALTFLMLTFGNFTIQSYDGGFQDFVYFGISVVLYALVEEKK